MASVICKACKEQVSPRAPRTAWKIATLLFWLAALATSLVFSLLLGLNVLLVPAWLGIGMAVGVAARRAAAWSCPACSAELTPPIPDAEEDRGRAGERLAPTPA